MITGPVLFHAAPAAAGLDMSKLVREQENTFPEVQKLNQEIQDLRDKREAVSELLELPRSERMDGLKKGNSSLYDEIHRAVDAKERSTAFRICAGTWIAGGAAALGVVAAAVCGVNVGVLGTIAFPAALALGTGISRLYLAASRKWLAPKKEDTLAVKIFKEYGRIFDEKIPLKEKQKADFLKRIADSNQAFADAATGSGEQAPGISQEEEFIDIGGVKLKVNQRFELITIPPPSSKKLG